MAQQVLQVGTTTVWFDDTKYKMNVYEQTTGVIELGRYNADRTNVAPVVNIYGTVLHWIDITGIAPTTAFGGIRFNLP